MFTEWIFLEDTAFIVWTKMTWIFELFGSKEICKTKMCSTISITMTLKIETRIYISSKIFRVFVILYIKIKEMINITKNDFKHYRYVLP